MTRLKQLGKDSLVYGVGGILAKGRGILHPADLHAESLALPTTGPSRCSPSSAAFMGAILEMGMDSAQSMYFFKHKAEGEAAQARVVSAISPVAPDMGQRYRSSSLLCSRHC